MAENLPYSVFECLEEVYDIYSQELHVEFMREYFRFESLVELHLAQKYIYLKGSIDTTQEICFSNGGRISNRKSFIELQ